MNDLAAALLRDAIISGMRIATETPIEQVPAAIADVLAALSRALDPALTERAEKVVADLRLPWFTNGCERYQLDAADLITALLTANAALRANTVQALDEADREYSRKTNDLIERHAEQLAALRAERDELERQVPRFPDHMARIVEAKNAGLPERLQALVAALEAIPDHMRQYQWVADQKQAFGSKWVRAICGDNGKGMGRQAIAEVVGHIDVADFIAAANPDTVSLMLAEAATLRAEVERLRGALQWCSGSDDFQDGGKAREGWLKLCAPLLHGEGKA